MAHHKGTEIMPDCRFYIRGVFWKTITVAQALIGKSIKYAIQRSPSPVRGKNEPPVEIIFDDVIFCPDEDDASAYICNDPVAKKLLDRDK